MTKHVCGIKVVNASMTLSEKLCHPPWLVCVGVEVNGLVLYTKGQAPKGLPDEWEGFPVRVQPMGSVRPL